MADIVPPTLWHRSSIITLVKDLLITWRLQSGINYLLSIDTRLSSSRTATVLHWSQRRIMETSFAVCLGLEWRTHLTHGRNRSTHVGVRRQSSMEIFIHHNKVQCFSLSLYQQDGAKCRFAEIVFTQWPTFRCFAPHYGDTLHRSR